MRLLLGLLVLLILVDSSKKLHEVVKDVGKRYVWELQDETKRDLAHRKRHRDWEALPESEVDRIKTENAKNLVNHFLEASSSGNKYFKASLTWISSRMSTEMTAQLCGGKPLNAYQYSKYMTSSGSHFIKTADNTLPFYEVVKTPRNTLQVNMKFTQIDSFGHNLHMHYDVTLNLTFLLNQTECFFKITHINQGGTCLDHGTYRYSTLEADSDVIKYLNTHPNSLLLINLFTPRIFLASQTTDDNDHPRIPDAWLSGLDANGAFIEVCRDGEPDPVRYTNDQLRSWYRRFQMMWHPASEDYMKTQIQHVNEDTVVARVTMTLIMGNLISTQTDWDFKISIRKNLRGDQKWYINQLKFTCAPTVDYMDMSLRAIPDVIYLDFLESIDDLPRPLPWYSAVEFLRKFTKNDAIEVELCRSTIMANLTQLELTLFENEYLRDTELQYYRINYEDIPLPAKELSNFRVNTISGARLKVPKSLVRADHEWTFSLKWDKMDQFYYIDGLEIGCADERFSQMPVQAYIRISKK